MAREGAHAGHGAHQGHLRICQDEKFYAYFFGIRTFEDIVADSEPADDGSAKSIARRFFQNFVRDNPTRRIVKLDIQAKPGKSQCDCGARRKGRGTADRLTRYCNCTGGTGTVCFSNKQAAITFRKQIKIHHGFHARGFLSQIGSGGSLYIDFCAASCSFNKQIRCSSTKNTLEGSRCQISSE